MLLIWIAGLIKTRKVNMPIPAAIPIAISAAGALGSLIHSFTGPKLPFDEADVQRLIDLQLSRTLADETSAGRRRLAAAGLGGSGVVNSILADNSSRIRSRFDEERQRLLLGLKQMQAEQSQQRFNQIGGALGGLAGLGVSLYGLSQPSPFADQLQQLQQLQSQQNLGGSNNYFQSNPNQSPALNLNPSSFQQLPANNYNYQPSYPGQSNNPYA